METKDVATFILSGGALVISFFSLYFSFFHKRFALVITLGAWNPRAEVSDVCQFCEVAVSNTGNRAVLVREVEALSFPEVAGELCPVLESADVPVVLKPGEIKLLKFSLPDLYLCQLAQSGRKLRLNFYVYTPEAKLKVATKDFVPPIGEVDIPQSDWEPFTVN